MNFISAKMARISHTGMQIRMAKLYVPPQIKFQTISRPLNHSSQF